MPAVIPIVASVAGAAIASRSAKKQTEAARQMNEQQIEANQLDPRIGQMLYGSDPNGNSGLLSKYAGLLDRPQGAGAAQFGRANENYAWNFTAPDLEAARGGAQRLLAGNISAPMMAETSMNPTNAPTVAAPYTPAARAATIDAPAQNKMDLTGSFGSLINGPAGANPYLTGAIQKGINQSSNAFGDMIEDAKTATRDVLGNVRGSAVASGMYGSSRQGLAEGKAMEAMTTQLGRAASQFGQNNTDAAVAAQAGAYDADRNRQLSATMGLSGQQYGVASQNAAMQQQAAQANAERQQQTAQFNAGLSQNNAQFNADKFYQTNLNNANFKQDANKMNLGAQLTTNALNQQGIQAGTGLLSGLTQQAGANASQYDQYDLNKATNVNGLLQPYLSKNPVPTQLQPVYSNSGGAALGGAMTGLSIANTLRNFGGNQPYGGAIGNPSQPYGSNGVF